MANNNNNNNNTGNSIYDCPFGISNQKDIEKSNDRNSIMVENFEKTVKKMGESMNDKFDELANKISDIDKKIDIRNSVLEKKIDKVNDILETKIDARNDVLETKIDKGNKILKEQINEVDNGIEKRIEVATSNKFKFSVYGVIKWLTTGVIFALVVKAALTLLLPLIV